MKQNILLYHDVDREETASLRHSSNNYSFVSYQCSSSDGGGGGGGGGGVPMVTDVAAAAAAAAAAGGDSSSPSSRVSLSTRLKQLFKEMEVQSK